MSQTGGTPVPPEAFGASASGGPIERISLALAYLAGAILVGLSLVVTASVLGRWFLGREVAGAFELVQVGVAVAAFLVLPICQVRRQNIIVDSFTGRASRRTQGALDGLWSLVYAAVALVLAWRLAVGGEETIRYRMVTSMIQLPYGWAMLAGAAALLFLGVAAAVVAVRQFRGSAA